MWIVRLALKRPYTFVVMALVIVILGVLAIFRMPTDIFPEINIPVASVIWSYSGMSPEETKQTALLLRRLAPALTLVIVEHDMSVVMAISDRISVLHRGELLAEGPPEQIRANAEVQAIYLGVVGR